MAIDPYVSVHRDAGARPKTRYTPTRGWRADRPGDLDGDQPAGGGFGFQGPDQGYALRLAELFRSAVALHEGEAIEDVFYGAIALASRRASLFGRAPIKDDVEIALCAWGYLPGAGSPPSPELLAARVRLFAGVGHHPQAHRQIAESVPEDILRLRPDDMRALLAAGEAVIDLDRLARSGH